MARAFFKVNLTVQVQKGAVASIVLPKVLGELDTSFVAVKDGAEEGIVRVEGSDIALKKVDQDSSCSRLTQPQMKALLKAYPPPNKKKRLRGRDIEMVQTVRSGFHLIDVTIASDTDAPPAPTPPSATPRA